jgi:hypothetical protein
VGLAIGKKIFPHVECSLKIFYFYFLTFISKLKIFNFQKHIISIHDTYGPKRNQQQLLILAQLKTKFYTEHSAVKNQNQDQMIPKNFLAQSPIHLSRWYHLV